MILKDLIPILKCDVYDIELGKSTIQVESLDNEVLEVTAWADECAHHLVVVLK